MKVKRNIEPLKRFCKELGIMEAQVFTFGSSASSDLSTRNICPREGIEDPACGVGNGALGAYLMKHVFHASSEVNLKSEQGEIANMPSVIHITGKKTGDKIEVFIGGKGRVMIKGEFYLDKEKLES